MRTPAPDLADFASDANELRARRNFMVRQGYRFCDIPACNCNSWHGGHAEQRLSELVDLLDDLHILRDGKTVLDALRDEITTLRAEVVRLRETIDRYPDPSPVDLCSPEFEAIWSAIKGWDISREGSGPYALYSGATGADVMHILLALRESGRAALTDEPSAPGEAADRDPEPRS